MRALMILVLALMPTGCTVASEVFSPHRDLKSPCTCLDESTPINVASSLTSTAYEFA